MVRGQTATLPVMAADVTVLIADPLRMAAIRDELRMPGRVLRFSSSNLASVLESIRANQPGIVAVDALFAETPPGKAFIERVDQLAIPSSEIRLVVRLNGSWATTPLVSAGAPGAPAATAATAPKVDAKAAGLNTRRVPRFLVLDPLKAVLDTSQAGLIDISVMGAQVMSTPALRPNQKVKVALPDGSDDLRVCATIAWSLFEKPKYANEPFYRAGIQFTDATKEALEDYCRRHGSEDPIPQRRR